MLLRAQATDRLRRILSLRKPSCTFQESADGYVSGHGAAASVNGEGAGIDAYVSERIRDYLKRPYLASKITGYLKDTEQPNLKVLPSGAIPYDLIDTTTSGPFADHCVYSGRVNWKPSRSSSIPTPCTSK